MPHKATRREFLATTAATGMGLLCTRHLAAAPGNSARKKALIGAPVREVLERFQRAGFDGLESNVWDIPPDEATKQRQMGEQLGMRIHSVMRGWANFNSPDSDRVAKDIDSVARALQTAQALGADAVLLVPCRLLAKVDVPKPEEFAIEFHPQTGHVTRVVTGDNARFEAYMKAQNEGVDASRTAIEKLIPVAEKAGVVIALENVWSNFWVKPELFAHFVASFQSQWVQSYFDIGNHVKYAAPEAWIEALGKTIVKVHVKDFVIDRSSPQGGKFVDIRDGDVNWPAVMTALDKIGYQGWFTIEGSPGLSLDAQSQRLDLILAGK